MIDRETALKMAHDFLDSGTPYPSDCYVILHDEIRETREAWIFPYQSERFLRTGDRTRFVTEGIWVLVRKDGDEDVSKRRPISIPPLL